MWEKYKPLVIYIYLGMATWTFLFFGIYLIIQVIPIIERLDALDGWINMVINGFVEVMIIFTVAITTVLIKLKAMEYLATFLHGINRINKIKGG